MKTYQYKAEQFIPIDLEHAWDFFSNPKNLSTLTPKEMDFTVLTELPAAIYENMIIDYTVKPLFGIPLKWQTKLSQWITKNTLPIYKVKVLSNCGNINTSLKPLKAVF